MLDRADPGVHGLIDRQRHRDMPRRAQPKRLGLGQRIEEQLGLQRTVGDLDEIDLVARLQAIKRGVDISRAADLDRPFPERRYSFDLCAGCQQPRPEQAARRNLAAPGEHLLGQIPRTVTDRRDAVRDIERQQRLILFDQLGPAAEMDVHVPQAGDQIASLALDRPRRVPVLRDDRVGADRDDIVALQHHRLPGDRLRRLDIDDRHMADDDIALFRRGERRRSKSEQSGGKSGKQIFHGSDLSEQPSLNPIGREIKRPRRPRPCAIPRSIFRDRDRTPHRRVRCRVRPNPPYI